MRSRMLEQLDALNTELIEMGMLIERSIEHASRALVNQDIALARETVTFDVDVDEKERAIENLCLKLLLQQQPVARDLRLISAALKMITDMERIGDQAADIAEIVIYLVDAPLITRIAPIAEMAAATVQMVKRSIDAFVRRDAQEAAAVIAFDDVVDALFMDVKNELIALISQDARHGAQALDLLMIAKYFERIGDHATNIAEWVEFAMTGKHPLG